MTHKKVGRPRLTFGIRDKFRESLRQCHFEHPTATIKKHCQSWYLDGHLVSRPLFGIYSMIVLSEHILFVTRKGRRNQKRSAYDAELFFSSVRSAVRNILSTFPASRNLRVKEVESVRNIYLRLLDEANATYNAVYKETRASGCPCCQGRGKLSGRDAKLLDAILLKFSMDGTIPRTSELFREPPLTP